MFLDKKFQLDFLSRNRLVRVPDSAQRVIKKIEKLTLDGINSVDEIAKQLGKKPDYIYDCLLGAEPVQKLPELMNSEDMIATPEQVEATSPVHQLFNQLDPDIKETVLLRMQRWTFRDIAKLLGQTAKVVKQWYDDAISWLKYQLMPSQPKEKAPLPAWARVFSALGVSPDFLASLTPYSTGRTFLPKDGNFAQPEHLAGIELGLDSPSGIEVRSPASTELLIKSLFLCLGSWEISPEVSTHENTYPFQKVTGGSNSP